MIVETRNARNIRDVVIATEESVICFTSLLSPSSLSRPRRIEELFLTPLSDSLKKSSAQQIAQKAQRKLRTRHGAQ